MKSIHYLKFAKTRKITQMQIYYAIRKNRLTATKEKRIGDKNPTWYIILDEKAEQFGKRQIPEGWITRCQGDKIYGTGVFADWQYNIRTGKYNAKKIPLKFGAQRAVWILEVKSIEAYLEAQNDYTPNVMSEEYLSRYFTETY